MKYTVIYEKGDSTWGAYVPDLTGVIAAGDSREEVESLIHEAVEFHIEGLRAEGLAVPHPASWAGTLDIVAVQMKPAPADRGAGLHADSYRRCDGSRVMPKNNLIWTAIGRYRTRETRRDPSRSPHRRTAHSPSHLPPGRASSKS